MISIHLCYDLRHSYNNLVLIEGLQKSGWKSTVPRVQSHGLEECCWGVSHGAQCNQHDIPRGDNANPVQHQLLSSVVIAIPMVPYFDLQPKNSRKHQKFFLSPRNSKQKIRPHMKMTLILFLNPER